MQYLSGREKYAQHIIERAGQNLKKIFERMAAGEAVRIWYSDNPDEHCGLYWFMNQLLQKKIACNTIAIVKLPSWEESDEGTILRSHSWVSEMHGFTFV